MHSEGAIQPHLKRGYAKLSGGYGEHHRRNGCSDIAVCLFALQSSCPRSWIGSEIIHLCQNHIVQLFMHKEISCLDGLKTN